MTIFGLNSPELFLLLSIILVILGTKRIEKGLDLFSRLIKFLISNQSNFDKKDKKEEPSTEIGESREKEEKLEKRLKTVNGDNKGKNSSKTNDSKVIKKDKTVEKLKTKNPKRVVNDKTAQK